MDDHTEQTDPDGKYQDRLKTPGEIKRESGQSEVLIKLDTHENNVNDLWLKIPQSEDVTAVAHHLSEVGCGSDQNKQLTVKLEDYKYCRSYNSNEMCYSRLKTPGEIKEELSLSEDVTEIDIQENSLNHIESKISKSEDITTVNNIVCEVGYGSDQNKECTVKVEDSKCCVNYSVGHRQDNTTDIINLKNEDKESGSTVTNTETFEKNEIISESLNIIRDDSGMTWYKCKFCAHKTKQKPYLVRHYKRKHDETVEYLTCEQCTFKTKMNSYLKRHIKRHHNNIQPYRCCYCDYKTSDKGNFTKHVRSLHENVEWHCCHFCEYKTKHKGALQTHFKYLHEENIEYHQCEFCEFKTKSKYSLKRHIEGKHEENPRFFRCQICEYKTKYASCLIQHKKGHINPIEWLKCKVCELRTKSQDILDKHKCRKRKKPIRYHQCKFCDYQTKYSCSLTKHVKRKHKTVLGVFDSVNFDQKTQK